MFKAFDKWLWPYLGRDRRLTSVPPKHLVITICDHFEPFHATNKRGALERVRAWHTGMQELCSRFRDSNGRPPKHTFFYPVEQYDEDVVASIGAICEATGSEGGIHLHHDNDNPESLERALVLGRDRLIHHGLLPSSGRYPFIHGNWALDHSHPDGRHCGVIGELGILRRTGCYADFTMPAAPNPCQTRTINSIYYATSTEHPKSHDRGIPASVETRSFREDPEKLLMVQGPLGLNWKRRKFGLLPRIENSDLTSKNPPTPLRLALWQRLAPRMPNRPEVAFIKLHTHGALERNQPALIGPQAHAFHKALASHGIAYHYATARELVNIIHALEEESSEPIHRLNDWLY